MYYLSDVLSGKWVAFCWNSCELPETYIKAVSSDILMYAVFLLLSLMCHILMKTVINEFQIVSWQLIFIFLP